MNTCPKRLHRGAVLILCLAVTPVIAADYPKEGRLDHRNCFSAEGHRVENSGIAFGSQVIRYAGQAIKPIGSPLDDIGGVCVVTYVQAEKGNSYANGYCENVDADGDKYVTAFTDEGAVMAGRFEAIGGTGKFVGASVVGEFKPIGPIHGGAQGHIQRCLHITGTYKLR